MTIDSNQRALLRANAVTVLRENDLGLMTRAAPDLYPHMWSWDAAFISIGLARISISRSIQELRTLIGAQWSNGMIPHIVFSGAPGYFPDLERWATQEAAPPGVRSSGICQPPVHAIALRHLLDRGRELGGSDQRAAETFVAKTFDKWFNWHRWLSEARDPDHCGLIRIYHGWESGMDNSPRFDGPYSRVSPGDVVPFRRTDTQRVGDQAQRPSDEEYLRYIWLIQQMSELGYDDRRLAEATDFRVKDVFFSAILAAASEVLSEIGDEFGRTAEADWLRVLANRCSQAVDASIDNHTHLAVDVDDLTGEKLNTPTLAGFAPLLSSKNPVVRKELIVQWNGSRWLGDPNLAFPLPASTSPVSSEFLPRTYWRGPIWPVMNWLFGWSFRRNGEADEYESLRQNSLMQLTNSEFAEYYEPFTNEALGSKNQSWTAAVALDWLDAS